MKNYSIDTIISPGRSFSSVLNLLLSILPGILAGEVIAGDGQSDSQDQTVTQSISMLEGKAFEGELGLLGEPARSTDLVIFNVGMFVSKKMPGAMWLHLWRILDAQTRGSDSGEGDDTLSNLRCDDSVAGSCQR